MKRFLATVFALSLAGNAMAMSVTDFIVDKDDLVGETVQVVGVATCIGGDMCLLSQGGFTLQAVVFDPHGLSRSERKRLIECDVMGCQIVVTGRGSDDAIIDLVATDIKWR